MNPWISWSKTQTFLAGMFTANAIAFSYQKAWTGVFVMGLIAILLLIIQWGERD